MIHFLTVHFHANHWIDVQLRHIERNTRGDYLVWGCLNGIDAKYVPRFHETFDLDGEHPEKLNVMSQRVGESAAPEDLIVFIDGDAFPVDDWVTPVTALLPEHRLVAVRRSENLGDIHPHPSFCVTTVGFWNELGGDWTRGGRPWFNTAGRKRQVAGSKVLEKLEDLGVPWHPLLRTNKRDLHPVLFGVYGDLVYHHGSSFRSARTTVDRRIAGTYRWPRGIMGAYANHRLRKRERRNLRASRWVFDQIERDDDFVRRFFMTSEEESAALKVP